MIVTKLDCTIRPDSVRLKDTWNLNRKYKQGRFPCQPCVGSRRVHNNDWRRVRWATAHMWTYVVYHSMCMFPICESTARYANRSSPGSSSGERWHPYGSSCRVLACRICRHPLMIELVPGDDSSVAWCMPSVRTCFCRVGVSWIILHIDEATWALCLVERSTSIMKLHTFRYGRSEISTKRLFLHLSLSCFRCSPLFG